MIIINGPKLPKKVIVACSGGVDSMAIVDFLSKKHEVVLAFYHHGKEDNSDQCYEFLEKFSKDRGMGLIVGFNNDISKPKEMSLEEYWRVKRYEFLHSFDMPVITGHHLDDSVETWIWSSMHGEGKIIPYRNKNVIRPFMTNRKNEFIDWCERKKVDWIEDETNETDITKTRNYIRNVIMPHVLKVNPGIHKVVKKKILAATENNT